MNTMQITGSGTTGTFSLDRQLERIGWALFLIMIGCLALLPEGWVPAGTWLAGTGVIMIGMNVVRRLKGVPTSRFTVVVGVLALVVGCCAAAGVDLPVFPLILAAIGLHILYGVAQRR